MLIRGSLAPDGGIVKLAVADDRRLDFAGPAVVFDSPAQALDAVRGGQVSAGQVVVLRGQGPTGSPGMGMASQLVFALDGAGLTGQVAVVTDGQLSGLVNKGIVVGEVSPEAARGGPLALVRDGDLIRIDVPARTADLDVPAAELQRRRGALRRRPAPKSGAGSPSTSAWSVPSRRAPCCESQPHETRPLPSASRSRRGGSAGAAAALRTAPALVVRPSRVPGSPRRCRSPGTSQATSGVWSLSPRLPAVMHKAGPPGPLVSSRKNGSVPSLLSRTCCQAGT